MFKAKSMNELMKQKRHNRIDEAKSQANVQSKIIYKAISPFVLTVFMAHPSLIQNSIIDSIKGSEVHTARVVVVYTANRGDEVQSRGNEVHTASRGGEQGQRAGAMRFLAAGELSRSLSLSLKLAHSFCRGLKGSCGFVSI